jgi:DNA-directed RNA polymerase subunit H (RpoH/RPB5)
MKTSRDYSEDSKHKISSVWGMSKDPEKTMLKESKVNKQTLPKFKSSYIASVT